MTYTILRRLVIFALAFLGLCLASRLSHAQAFPGAAISPGRANVKALNPNTFACAVTQVTVVGTPTSATVIPATTCLAEITSGPAGATTLTSTTPIANGTINGQTLRVANATGNTVSIQLNMGSNIGLLPGGGTTLTLAPSGGTADFFWVAGNGIWIIADNNGPDAAQIQTGVLPSANGGRLPGAPTYTTATTVTIADYVAGASVDYNSNPAGGTVINLPDCSHAANVGVTYSIKNMSAQTLTITPVGSQKIDTAATVVMNTQFQALTFECGNASAASDANWTVR